MKKVTTNPVMGTGFIEGQAVSMDSIELGQFFDPAPKFMAKPGKRAPVPSQPWVDAMDLMREAKSYREPGKTCYYWRDTDMVVEVDDETNEIVGIFKDDYKNG